MKWYSIELGYAVYAVAVEEDEVVRAPPIARWMIGKKWDYCRNWIRGKNGKIEEMSDE